MSNSKKTSSIGLNRIDKTVICDFAREHGIDEVYVGARLEPNQPRAVFIYLSDYDRRKRKTERMLRQVELSTPHPLIVTPRPSWEMNHSEVVRIYPR